MSARRAAVLKQRGISQYAAGQTVQSKTTLSVENQSLESFLMTFEFTDGANSQAIGCITIPLPVLAQSTAYAEYWHDGLVAESFEVTGGYALRTPAHLALVFSATDHDLGSLVQQVYQTAYATGQEQGYRHLLRTWNFIHDINGIEHNMERYQTFCVARHEVLETMGLLSDPNPAATAIGSLNGVNCFVFLFSKQGGQVIENSRQVSAWQYPKQYAPKQPRFSRAMLQGGLLMCSGTASVVGHATQHLGDFAAQFNECIKNVGVLLESSGMAYDLLSGLFRFYLRDQVYLTELQKCIAQSGIRHFVILHGEVCRENLLVECEAVFQ